MEADENLGAVAQLGMSVGPDTPHRTQRLVALLVDGLRYGVR